MNTRFFLALILLAVGTPALAAPYYDGELIFPLQDKHVHGSSIVECPNGDLLAVWFHGSGERTSDDVKIQGARLKQGDDAWSPVFLAADTPNLPDCNPVLYIDAQQRLWMFWIAVQANRWETSLLKYRRAEDYLGDGAPRWSWQDAIVLTPGEAFYETMKDQFRALKSMRLLNESMWAEYGPPYSRLLLEAAQDKMKRRMGWMTRIHPLTLPSGRILLPLYSDGFNASLVAISDDLGETWRASLPMIGLGPIQPTVVRKQDGTLAAYCRDSGGPPSRAMLTTSSDDGESWSLALDSDLVNPGSSLEVIGLREGLWAVAHNDEENGRHSLLLALSDDEGTTWKWKRHLDRVERRRGSFAYPSLIQGADGRLHITYSYKSAEAGSGATIKHATFNVDWVKEGN